MSIIIKRKVSPAKGGSAFGGKTVT